MRTHVPGLYVYLSYLSYAYYILVYLRDTRLLCVIFYYVLYGLPRERCNGTIL